MRPARLTPFLVTELSRWGRSTQGLVQTLDDLHGWKVSVLAQTGLSFDLGTRKWQAHAQHHGWLGRVRAGPIRERVKSGLAAAKATIRGPMRTLVCHLLS
jgi:putative DNA-invertase from lambdoid prophage Rac